MTHEERLQRLWARHAKLIARNDRLIDQAVEDLKSANKSLNDTLRRLGK